MRVGAAQSKSPPNLIVIIADDVGWNDLGAYGHPHVRTPHLDRLAREGMRFDRAFLTCSSCSPSRASIMTGRYPHSTGAAELHQPLPADQIVFAGLLQQAGYYTAAAGKWHLGDAAKGNFDRIAAGRPSGCEQWTTILKERPRDRPFFLWLASFDAHRPYADDTLDEPHVPADVVVPPFLPDVAETRVDLALYYDEITRLDGYVGRVMDELAAQHVADETVVMFISDNGRPFPRCKTTLYDSGVQTPLIVRWPTGVKPGAICGSLVSSVDLAPTLLELAGVDVPAAFQGKSFRPLLADPDRSIRQYVYAEHNWHDYQAHQRSARSAQYLYIKNAVPHLPATPPADAVRSPTFAAMQRLEAHGELSPRQRGCFLEPQPAEELYDVAADPYSLLNLAKDPDHVSALTQMRDALAHWSAETDDRVPETLTLDRFDRTTGERLSKAAR